MARYWSMTRDVQNADEVRTLMRRTEQEIEEAKATSQSDSELMCRLTYLEADMLWLREKLVEYGGSND